MIGESTNFWNSWSLGTDPKVQTYVVCPASPTLLIFILLHLFQEHIWAQNFFFKDKKSECIILLHVAAGLSWQWIPQFVIIYFYSFVDRPHAFSSHCQSHRWIWKQWISVNIFWAVPWESHVFNLENSSSSGKSCGLLVFLLFLVHRISMSIESIETFRYCSFIYVPTSTISKKKRFRNYWLLAKGRWGHHSTGAVGLAAHEHFIYNMNIYTMNTLLRKCHLPNLILIEIESLNRSISYKWLKRRLWLGYPCKIEFLPGLSTRK